MRFSKILPRRLQGRGDESLAKNGPPLQDATDFHQLTSRRANGHAALKKKAPRTGKSRIIIPDISLEDKREANGTNGRSEDETPGTVCEICSNIDFPKILAWKPGDPRPWVPLTHTLKDKSMCPYCTFFQAMIGHVPNREEAQNESQGDANGENDTDENDTGTFTPYLRIRQAFERLGISQKHPLAKSVLFEVTTKSKTLPRGYIVRATIDEVAEPDSDESQTIQPALISGRAIAPRLNPLLVRKWLNTGGESQTELDSETNKGASSKTSHAKLIDCNKNELVTLQDQALVDAKYAIFSYDVGGEREEESKETKSLPEELPPLFRDAVLLTKSIGIPYLWIDQYCTPLESDTIAWKQHVEQIGHLHQNAALAIITTASESIENGIHGVSVPRDDQLSLQIGTDIFTTSLVRPDIEIGTSKWSSRAWNLQAGLLSTKKLVLTPSQAYFQCGTFHCVESLSVPTTDSTTPNLGRVFPANKDQSINDLSTQIAMYINRDIRVPEQRLDAFTGILKSFSQGPRGISSFLGLPLFHPDDLTNRRVVSQTDLLCASLGWTTSEKKRPSVSLQEDDETKQNEYTDPYILGAENPFPSWTWLAWRPRVPPTIQSMSPSVHPFNFNLVLNTEKPLQGVCAPPGTEISVGFEDDMVVSWEIDGEAIARRAERIKFLRIQTFCFEIKVTRKQGTFALNEPTDALSDSNRDIIEQTVRLACSDDPTSATDKEEFYLTGILIAGRNWRKEEPEVSMTNGNSKPAASKQAVNDCPGDGAATVLLCAKKGWAEDGHLVRLGAMSIFFAELSVLPQSTGAADANSIGSLALLRGVGDSTDGTGELHVAMTEVDLY